MSRDHTAYTEERFKPTSTEGAGRDGKREVRTLEEEGGRAAEGQAACHRPHPQAPLLPHPLPAFGQPVPLVS